MEIVCSHLRCQVEEVVLVYRAAFKGFYYHFAILVVVAWNLGDSVFVVYFSPCSLALAVQVSLLCLTHLVDFSQDFPLLIVKVSWVSDDEMQITLIFCIIYALKDSSLHGHKILEYMLQTQRSLLSIRNLAV